MNGTGHYQITDDNCFLFILYSLYWQSRHCLIILHIKFNQKIRLRYVLQWRHNGRDGVSNHRRLDGLLSRLFRRRSKKHQSSASLAFVRGIHRWQLVSPHKGQVTGKTFPFDDVIMIIKFICKPYWLVPAPAQRYASAHLSIPVWRPGCPFQLFSPGRKTVNEIQGRGQNMS